jgi:hypothetical protein
MTNDAQPTSQTVHATDAATTAALAELRRAVGRLKVLTGLLAIVLAGIIVVAAVLPPTTSEVLRAERLEIVEPDGSLAFVLANSARPAVATIDGVPILAGQEAERRNPSFIFFDGQGDEVGGMMFRNQTTEAGGMATRHLSLDAYKQDQTVVLHHYQDARGSHAGLSVTDRPQDTSIADAFRALGLEPPVERRAMMAAFEALPEAERNERLAELFGGANRVFVGTTRARDAVLVLRDARGRPRLQFGVPADGPPYVRLLGENGEVVWEAGQGAAAR